MAFSTELALSSILDDRDRLKNKLQLASDPLPKNKRYTISLSHPVTPMLSREMPKMSGYSTQLS